MSSDTSSRPSSPNRPASPPVPQERIERDVLDIVTGLSRESNPAVAARARRGIDGSLERDHGLDSLGRMELFARAERSFGVVLSERSMAEIDTPRELAAEIARAAPAQRRAPVPEAHERTAPERAREADDAAAGGREPASGATLVDALEWHVARHPDRVHVRFLDEDLRELTLTYGELHGEARRVAGGLHAAGVMPGQSVAIMLPTELGYFAAFFGVLIAGAVPVPIYPPARLNQIEDHFSRHARILSNACAVALVTFEEARRVVGLLTAQVDGLEHVFTMRELAAGEIAPDTPPVDSESIAFLQYTSGSTGNPKGVVLTHGNVLANLRSMQRACSASASDVFVSWLPLYHDMGLIGAWLGALYVGYSLVLMSPLTFLARPHRWLRAIHEHRGTMSGGPNFAFELCLRRLDDADLEGLDLSSWRMAFNGAEPVSEQSMERFAARLEPYGFAREALTPVYGLAEATLGVAFTPTLRGPRYDRVDRDAMSRRGRAAPARAGGANALTFVSCGPPIPDFEVRTVDEGGRETAEREVGAVQFRGPGCTAGYFRNEAATSELLVEAEAGDPGGRWRNSGDLGYVAGGELYLTGRTKDVIIRAGRNVYPYELEQDIAGVDGVRRGCVAAFGAGDPGAGTEKLVIVAETREQDAQAREQMLERIGALTVERLGMPADDVVLASPQTVLKTSSGKIRRTALRELYERGALRPSRAPVWIQFARLTLAGAAPAARRCVREVAAFGYAAWCWACFVPAALIAWAGVSVLPDRAARWRFAGRVARAMLRLARIPVERTGAPPAQQPHGALVWCFNHSSYLDGFVVLASLDRPVRFVAKGELAGFAPLRRFLERLGCLFVERFAGTKTAREADKLKHALERGEDLGVFPEGTLHRMPGLLPFQLGAFAAAAGAGAPVVPVVLLGTRSILRGESRFPRRGAVGVHVLDAVEPDGAAGDWDRAVALRDAVRARMLARAGEPDLADRRPLLDLAEQIRPR